VKWGLVMMVILLATLLPTPAFAQGDYGVRIPSKLPGCFAPVASRLIGSNENDHSRRGSPTLAYDWSASVGSPVFSICPGIVRRTSSANEGGYGWNVVIDHGGGYSSLYAHCLENSFKVKPGQQVTAWTQICSIGRTGMTSWPHVHLNIDYKGAHQPVGNFFDSSLIRYCHFTKCQATNKPGDPIQNSGQWVAQPQATTSATIVQSRYAQLLRILAQYPPQTISLGVMAILGAFVAIYWLGGQFERVAIGAGLFGMVGAALIVWLMVPTGGVTASQSPAVEMSGSAAWDKVYPIVQSMEGWACTNDGAYTMGGVTQGTYNRWRAKKGLGNADVCQSLTREQAKAIYYELFWLPIGADKMPAALALTAVDHYINTGKVRHLLAQCGQDVACFNRARIADYQTKGNCSLYCRAWINRVNKIRKYTGG
jgi:hypothetical protein